MPPQNFAWGKFFVLLHEPFHLIDDFFRAEVIGEGRNLEPYLDLAGCEGEARERALELAPRPYAADVAWYLLRKPTSRLAI